jgi:putative membrane protein
MFGALVLIGLAVVTGHPLLAQMKNAQLEKSDPAAMFVKNATESGLAEVQLSQLALTKSQNPQVKAFADEMVRDHTAANEALMRLASSKNIPVPTAVSERDKATLEQLAKLYGRDFDRMYLAKMVSDHEKAVSLFQKEAASGSNPELKAWAKSTLPTLQRHLDMAEHLAAGVS